MRSNLLSLQNIASQQDIVQNRLATGLKVSSAIDNPSSYYTASSLNNRAADLTALLDSMSQGIQTIKAASEAIASGTKFLEQAKAVANQALEKAIPDKEWFAEQENVMAVVSSKEELLAAVGSGKAGNIVVYGEITLNDTLVLQAGQNLVGVGYYGKFDNETDKFSKLNLDISTFSSKRGLAAEHNNTLISDLSFNIKFADIDRCQGIYLGETADNTKGNILQNLDIRVDTSDVTEYPAKANYVYAIYGGGFELKGNNNIYSERQEKIILHVVAKTYVEMKDNTVFNIDSRNNEGGALYCSVFNLYDNSYLNIYSRYWGASDTTMTLNNGSRLDIHGPDSGFLYGDLYLNDQAMVNIEAYYDFYSYKNRPTSLHVNSAQAVLNLTSRNTLFRNTADNLFLSAVSGAKVIVNGQAYSFNRDYGYQNINDTLFMSMLDKHSDSGDYSPKWNDIRKQNNQRAERKEKSAKDISYRQLIEQYDALISDASYKGVNLLAGQNLKVNFNEDRSSKIDVAGVKADSESLGLKTKEWKTAEDIEKSVSELEEAINSLRGFASEFGNYYSIVTTRQDFTENLINVLEEGADKLTLADMNQESANMLALQTSQQLAVNSLSLASQASQGILRLF